ncbi:DUF4174 domain-containing protein [Mycobacterium sp. WMMD1722]|uniref:DUF4174 domain-containing protein n=1 Tax=Mycobacterium sp. WMMD1722 TaxID=3404117 RepID=UPI003BF602C6
MALTRGVAHLAFLLAVLVSGGALGPATAAATELDDYLWQRRPLLLFAPTDRDPRLAETLNRIEVDRCDVDDRDMVIGVVVTEGTSTLDGRALSADQSRRLKDRYAIDDSAFTAVLIGKDGGEKLRIDDVPDLHTVYAVIDGMPMRSREMTDGPGRC